MLTPPRAIYMRHFSMHNFLWFLSRGSEVKSIQTLAWPAAAVASGDGWRAPLRSPNPPLCKVTLTLIKDTQYPFGNSPSTPLFKYDRDPYSPASNSAASWGLWQLPSNGQRHPMPAQSRRNTLLSTQTSAGLSSAISGRFSISRPLKVPSKWSLSPHRFLQSAENFTAAFLLPALFIYIYI